LPRALIVTVSHARIRAASAAELTRRTRNARAGIDLRVPRAPSSGDRIGHSLVGRASDVGVTSDSGRPNSCVRNGPRSSWSPRVMVLVPDRYREPRKARSGRIFAKVVQTLIALSPQIIRRLIRTPRAECNPVADARP
jgi:hypothetical protein